LSEVKDDSDFVKDIENFPEFDKIREIATSKDSNKADRIENDLFLMISRNYVKV
jgi:hypothetical protein